MGAYKEVKECVSGLYYVPTKAIETEGKTTKIKVKGVGLGILRFVCCIPTTLLRSSNVMATGL